MLNCYITQKELNAQRRTATPLVVIAVGELDAWLNSQVTAIKNWVLSAGFKADPNTFCLIPGSDGKLSKVLVGVRQVEDFWALAGFSISLPTSIYRIENITDPKLLQQIFIAFGLGAYNFSRYKQSNRNNIRLVIPDIERDPLENMVTSIYWVRDLINTPTEDMGPQQVADAAMSLAKSHGAKFSQIVGEELLTQNYPIIYAVGRASNNPPRLIDLRWGQEHHPRVTLVGKGVCFDSGGLDLKSSSNMLLMKKDMAGAAHALGLARIIMTAKLPIQLRVLIPAVENVVSGNAYKPGDILKSRKGITVEIGNTDAEGRLILADALAEASTENPELLIDFTTLTGSARVAVGTDIAAMFTPDDALAASLFEYSQKQQDPIWRLPLYAPYREFIDTPFADINNSGATPYAGAIIAGLFLQEFVDKNIPWVHFDFMAWNFSPRSGRPQGGEALTLRALFAYLCDRYIK